MKRDGSVDPVTAPRSESSANRWLILIAMTGSLSMILLDQTVVSVALPSMTRELPLTALGQQWVVNAYVLGLAALVAFGGKLGGLLGRVTTFRLGVITFFLASVACALTPRGELGEPFLLTARAVQGAGAALMVPVSATIVMSAFGVAERGKAIALYAGIGQVFLAVGPLIGGVLTESVSWRAVFWLNVPVGLGALALVRIARPDNSRQPGGAIRPLDAAMLVTGIGGTVLAVQQSSQWGWLSARTIVVLIIGAVVGGLFVMSQRTRTDPLLDVRLLARPGLAPDLIVAAIVQFGLLGIVLYESLYLQDLLHLSPARCGVAVLPFILPIAVAAQVGGRWFDRAGVRPPVLTGLAVCVAGLVVWTLSLPHLSYPLQIPGMVVMGFGLGLTISPNNTDALSRVEDRNRAQASALLQTFAQVGGTLGVAVIGTVVLSVEHRATLATSRVHAAHAITAGFAAAAVAFTLALIIGLLTLSRERISGEHAVVEPAV